MFVPNDLRHITNPSDFLLERRMPLVNGTDVSDIGGFFGFAHDGATLMTGWHVLRKVRRVSEKVPFNGALL
jgi:hypothetical protein